MENSKNSYCNIINSIKGLDIFGKTISFRINNKREYKSICGGITSISYIIFVIFFCSLYFRDFVTRSNVSLLFTNKITEKNPSVNLTENSFAIGFSLVYQSNSSDATKEFEKYFDFSFDIIQWIGEGEFRTINVPLNKCLQENFKGADEALFIMNGIDKMFCPNLTMDYNFTIAGLFTDYWFQFLQLKINLKPEYLVDLSNLKKKMLENPLQATTFFIDTGIDYDNISNPLPVIINYYSTSVSLYNYKIVEVFLSTLEFKSDSNILYADPTLSSDTTLDKVAEYSLQTPERNIMKPEYGLGIAKFIIKCSAKLVIVSRTYQKFPDFLANVSALLSQILFLVMMVINYTNRKSADNKIMSRVLKYNGKKDFDIKYLMEIFSSSKVNENEEILKVRKSIQFNEEDFPFKIEKEEERNDTSNGKNSENNSNCNSFSNSNNSSNENIQDEKVNSNNSEIHNENIKEINLNRNINLYKIKPSLKNPNNSVFLPKILNYSHISEMKSISNPNNEIEDSIHINKKTLKFIEPPNELLQIPSRHQRQSILRKKKLISQKTTLYFVDNSVKKKDLEINQEINEKLFKLNAFEIIFIKAKCCCARFKNRKKIIKAGEDKMFFYLDVLTYIKKMQEIDILKYLLLSADQLYLFNFLSKPPVATNDVSSQVYKEFLMEQKRSMSLNKDEIEQMHECYYNILNEQDLTVQDKKLINLIDAEIDSIKN